jgi:HrpA-like RNA helicase
MSSQDETKSNEEKSSEIVSEETDKNVLTLFKQGMLTNPKVAKHKIPIDVIEEILNEAVSTPAKSYGDRIFIVQAGTASGKSTVIPPMLYNKILKKTGRNILITQPRIINTVDIASSLTEFNKNLKLGKNLGYMTGEFRLKNKENGIVFSNVDYFSILVENMKYEDLIKRYAFILIDEVHVENINLINLLFIVKKFMMKMYSEKKCPIVMLMSATLDINKLSQYFSIPSKNVIIVEGATANIKTVYMTKTPMDINECVVRKAIDAHEKNTDDKEDNMNIIIFCKGGGDIKKIRVLLNEYNVSLYKSGSGKKNIRYIAPIELTSESYTKGKIEYKNLFSNVKDIIVQLDLGGNYKNVIPTRKVILATNVAETGLTIRGLKYCVDNGQAFTPEFNPEYGYNLLIPKLISKGMATQRKGRVGRRAYGEFHPCYTEKTFESMDTFRHGEILTNDISKFLLRYCNVSNESDIIPSSKTKISALDIDEKLYHNYHEFYRHKTVDSNKYAFAIKKDVDINIDLIDRPSIQSMEYGLKKLYNLGFIDHNCNTTVLGYLAFKMSGKISLEAIRMILQGYYEQTNIQDLIIIASAISIGHRLIVDEKKYKKRDIITMANTINKFQRKRVLIGGKAKSSNAKSSNAKSSNAKKYKIADDDVVYTNFVNNVLIADVFIDILLLYNEYLYMLEYYYDKDDFVSLIDKWCLDNHVHHNGLVQLTTMKEEIMENCLALGINPYKNDTNGNLMSKLLNEKTLGEAFSDVKKIKKCIYIGHNEYMLVNVNGKYMWKGHVIDMGFVPNNPNFIVVNDIYLRNMFDKYALTYNGYYSVMDGFVDVDVDLN